MTCAAIKAVIPASAIQRVSAIKAGQPIIIGITGKIISEIAANDVFNVFEEVLATPVGGLIFQIHGNAVVRYI